MLSFRVSYVSMLQAVSSNYGLPYLVHEITQDGSHLYGIELELPASIATFGSPRRFYWAPSGTQLAIASEAAALQALMALQTLFGFVIVDYSLHSLLLYRNIAQWLLPVANRGVQLARLLLMDCYDGTHNTA